MFVLVSCHIALAQDTIQHGVNHKKLYITGSIVATGYVSSMVVLGQVWYKDQPREPFHFFNDAGEWKQMDKAGHFFASWQAATHGTTLLRNCGWPTQKSARVASLASFMMVSTIEVFDGLASGYGASLSDLAANAAGAAGSLLQHEAWNEIRITPKYSFHFTPLAAVRPSLLGNGPEEIVKDYNGHTFWLSCDVRKFAKNSRWPGWLNLAGGYGADNMVTARDASSRDLGYAPYRQYYVSVDLNWTAIPTRSRFLKTVFAVMNIVKFPAPALEFSSKGVKAHALYF